MDAMPMRFAEKRARCVRGTSPYMLAAFRALPIDDRRRARALVFRRGYPLHKVMEIPPKWWGAHLLYGYEYRRPWSGLKSCIVVVVWFLVVLYVFSYFWGL